MHLGGRIAIWHGVGGVMPVVLEVQRKIYIAANWTLHMALCKHCGPA